MRFADIDIGSRTIELVVREDGETIESKQTDSGFDPMTQAKEMLEGVKHDLIIATAMAGISLSFPLMRRRSRRSRPMP